MPTYMKPYYAPLRSSCHNILLFVVLLVTGCAADIPQAIGERPPQDLSLAQARAAGQAALGRYVRWGGRFLLLRPGYVETVDFAPGRR